MLSERQGRAGRMAETLHLKLRLFHGAVQAVYRFVHSHGRPLLNLSSASFRVSFAEPVAGLPFLWTMRVELVDPGDAVSIDAGGADEAEKPYFIRAGADDRGLQGEGSLRVRDAVTAPGGRSSIVGTMNPDRPMRATGGHLIWFRAPLADDGATIDLYATVDPEQRLADHEWRIRSVPRVLPPAAVDELQALATQVRDEYDAKRPLAQRIGEIFTRDTRWLDAIGPHHLTGGELSPAEAETSLPMRLWYETLAVLVRMFPGAGPDSVCAGEAVSPPGALQQAFVPTLTELDQLLLRSRSLVVTDWRFNEEVRSLVMKQMAVIGREPGSTAGSLVAGVVPARGAVGGPAAAGPSSTSSSSAQPRWGGDAARPGIVR
jgi:hypothetical protein